jgi:hypothetical protein
MMLYFGQFKLMKFGFLFQFYPAYTNAKKQITICALAGLAVFFTLFFIEPFGIDQFSVVDKLNYSALYASIAFVISCFYIVICPACFPKLFGEQHWVVYKEVLTIAVILITISFVNLITHHILENYPLTIQTTFLSLSYTLPISAFPVTLTILVKQRILQQKYMQQSLKLNQAIQLNADKNFAQNETDCNSALNNIPYAPQGCCKLVLTGTNEAEVIELEERSLLFIKSEDNYAKVYYQHADKVQSIMLRNTLKNLEIKTENFSCIKRCHRGYIVNLARLESVQGDSQGLKLKLDTIEAPIPVGKNYLDSIRTHLGSTKP